MANYIVTFKDQADLVCNTYDDAVSLRGLCEIYLAPDKNKPWLPGHPQGEQDCFVLNGDSPVRAKYVPLGTRGFYLLPGHGGRALSAWKTKGWLPMDWFRSFPADDEDMRRWQEEDEYGDRDCDDPYDF